MSNKFVRRRFSRITFDAPASLSNGSHSWSCDIADISLNGVLISRPTDWQGGVEENFLLDISLPGSNVRIGLELVVAHTNEDFIGFRCLAVSKQSQAHLQRLVELNLGDPELLYRELAELLSV